MATLAGLVALAPWSWLGTLAAPLGWLAGSVLRIRRGQVESALTRAGVPRARHTARSMYRSLAHSLFEFFWMAGRGSLRLDQHVVFSDSARSQLALANAHDCGAIIATAHTGNWDLVGCAAASSLSSGLTVVTKRLHVSWLDRAWQGIRASRGIELVEGRDLYRNLTRRLRAGRNVALVIDQAPERTSSVTSLPFAGAMARYDLLPAVLSLRTGAPILLALGRRRSDGQHVVDVPIVLRPPGRASRAWVLSAMSQLNASLDAFVREHPDQWLWLHRRWKALAPRPALSSKL